MYQSQPSVSSDSMVNIKEDLCLRRSTDKTSRGIYYYYEQIEDEKLEKCKYTSIPHTLYHILLIGNEGEYQPTIGFSLMFRDCGSVRFVGLDNIGQIDSSLWEVFGIDYFVIKRFLDIQYTKMIELSIQDTLSFKHYKSPRDELKFTLEFLDVFGPQTIY